MFTRIAMVAAGLPGVAPESLLKVDSSNLV